MEKLENIKEPKKIGKKQIYVIIFLIIAIVLIIIGVLASGKVSNEVTQKISTDDKDVVVSVNYPKEGDYEYKEMKSDLKKVEISQKNEDYVVNIEIDTETLKNTYKGSFDEYKEMKTAGFNAQDITINGLTGFGFYDSNKDQYQIVLPGNGSTTINVYVVPIIRFKGENAEQLFSKENVRSIIDSIKIKTK